MKTAGIYGASEIFGCTVVVVMDAGALVLGHFPEESGNTITLESREQTEKIIIKTLNLKLDMEDWTDEAEAYIVHSRRSAVTGLNAIKDGLMGAGLPQANIK